MQLVLFTLVISLVCGMGLGLGLLLRRQGLARSCGGSVEYVDGRFVRVSCETCKTKGIQECPDDEAPAA